MDNAELRRRELQLRLDAAEREGDGQVHFVLPQTDGALHRAVEILENVAHARDEMNDRDPESNDETQALGLLAVIVEEVDFPLAHAEGLAPTLAQPVAPDRRARLTPLAFPAIYREMHTSLIDVLDQFEAGSGDTELEAAIASQDSTIVEVQSLARRVGALMRLEFGRSYDVIRRALGQRAPGPARRVVLQEDEYRAYCEVSEQIRQTWGRH